MKLIKLSFIVAVAIMAIIGITTTSYAFHSGGVASCESCHTMHNSLEGKAMAGTGNTTPTGVGNPAGSKVFLLRGSDQSSTCLNCHEGPTLSSYHVSTPLASFVNSAPVNRGPGGDFGWLKIATTTSTATTSAVQRHGHNIIAADFNYVVDPQNATAPGGTFDATKLSCISCHNPHNQLRITGDDATVMVKPAIGSAVGAIAGSASAVTAATLPTVAAPKGPYRFLRGAGADQAPKSNPYVFAANPPVAVSPSSYNRSESATDTHIAYGSGMSAWCGNCHSAMNDSAGDIATGNAGHPHPVNKVLGADIMANYNAYKGSGDLTGALGYTSLVPVEMGSTSLTLLANAAAVTGRGATYAAIDANAKVMCLSCHRAHATGFPSMTRFYIGGQTTDSAGNYALQSGQVLAQAQAAYYERPSNDFTVNTKNLCNKCHAKD